MTNKGIISIFLAVLVVVLIALLNYDSFFINSNVNNNNQSENSIEDIRLIVSQIDSGLDYETITLNNEEFLEDMTDGGGQLRGYYKDGVLYKIEETLGLSYGVITYSYYFNNGNLILIHELEEDFPYSEDTGSLDYSQVAVVFSGYYYIEKESLVDYQINGKKRFDSGETIQEKVAILIGYSKEDIELLNQG